MSKKYKGKICVYCAKRVANTADHVFAREFFLPQERLNLPKVPACEKCNRMKASIEHYLTCILPFSGRNFSASEYLVSRVDKRLRNNLKLKMELSKGIKKIWVKDNNGLILPSMAIPLDGDRLIELFRYITKGLLWFHWRVLLDDGHEVIATALIKHGVNYFDDKLFSKKLGERVKATLGNGTFNYEGLQGIDMPEISVWKYTLYGGGTMMGDKSDEPSSVIGVLTGPKEFASPKIVY